jgi:mRNA-capping enzyme
MFTIKDNEDDDQAGGSTGAKKKKPRREVAQDKAKFMEGIPNVNLVTDMEITSRVQNGSKTSRG